MKLLITIIFCLFIFISLNAREYKLSSVSVYDGDTIKGNVHLGLGIVIYMTKVRLGGINTPEKKTKRLLEKKAGLIVTEYLKSIVDKGKVFLLITDDKDERGSFKRPMGILFIDGINICEILLKKRFAKVFYAKKKKSWLDSELNIIIKGAEK